MIEPVILPISDATSLAAGGNRITETAASNVDGSQAGALSFLDAVSHAGTSAMTDLRQAESVSMSALQGNAGPREVAEAVMEAEKSLQIAIAVRDRIVTAYMEISRMAI